MPREDVTVMEQLSSDAPQLKEKVIRLTEELNEVESQKKAANKGFNDTIKDLKEEIKMTLSLLKEMSQE